MARARNQKNGRLEEAMANLVQSQATLVQNQATLVQNQASFLARMAETDARMAETDREIAEMQRVNAERFARIEAILLEHSRILQALPDAISEVRDKIGFRAPEQQQSDG